jgi:hypothetical protein
MHHLDRLTRRHCRKTKHRNPGKLDRSNPLALDQLVNRLPKQ